MVKVKSDVYLEFVPNSETSVEVIFKSSVPAIYYDPELEKNVKKEGEEVELILTTQPSTVVDLYLKLKTFEESFASMEESVVISNEGKRLIFYKTPSKPYTLAVKGVDYINKKAGIIYIDITNYTFVSFLSYLKLILEKMPILSFQEGDVVFTYNKQEELLFVEDKDLDKFHYIERDQIAMMHELWDYYVDHSILFAHHFTPDHNVGIMKDGTFVVNDKKFDIKVFKKLVALTRI